MSWLWILALAVLALFALRFLGKLVAGLLGIIVVGVAASFAWQQWQTSHSEQLIPPASVTIEELRLTDTDRGPREVSGRIHNGSARYTLTRLETEIQVKDCVGENCEVVTGDTLVLRTEIPPGESREFRQPMFLQTPREWRGRRRIGYQITKTAAR